MTNRNTRAIPYFVHWNGLVVVVDRATYNMLLNTLISISDVFSPLSPRKEILTLIPYLRCFLRCQWQSEVQVQHEKAIRSTIISIQFRFNRTQHHNSITTTRKKDSSTIALLPLTSRAGPQPIQIHCSHLAVDIMVSNIAHNCLVASRDSATEPPTISDAMINFVWPFNLYFSLSFD